MPAVVAAGQKKRGPKIKEVVKNCVRERGFVGLYAGFGTVVFGAIPLRMVYLSTLEYTKGNARKVLLAHVHD